MYVAQRGNQQTYGFGDNEPAHLLNVSVLRKAKEQRHNVDLGISVSDPIENIKRMKYGIHAGYTFTQLGWIHFLSITGHKNKWQYTFNIQILLVSMLQDRWLKN